MRQSGIGVVGRVPWGTHLCQIYDTSDDITAMLVPYFLEGLNAHESCTWITSAPLTVRLATRALGSVIPDLPGYIKSGQMEILDFRQWYRKNTQLTGEGVPGWFQGKIAETEQKGFSGVRFADNPSWLRLHGGNEFPAYEREKEDVFKANNILAISVFAAAKMAPMDIARLAARHRFTIIGENGTWEVLGEFHPGKPHKVPIVTDTSAKIRAEEERDRIWNLSRDILCIMDPAGTFRDVNPAFRTVLGFDKHEVVGKRYGDFIPAYDLPAPRSVDGKLFENFLTADFVNRYRCRDGSCRWLEWSAVAAAHDGLIYATARDITERRAAYEDQKRKNAELTAANAELSAAEEELTRKHAELNSAYDDIARSQEELRKNVDALSRRERELSISESNLRHALEEKEVLIAEIHHRVKNNLTAFISLLSLGSGDGETEAVGQMKRDLQNRARSMALIHETLYRTKRYSSVDMGMYLESLVGEITSSYPSRRSILTVVNAEGVHLDLARATPCGLIINELVTNSLMYAFPNTCTGIGEGNEPCTIRVALTLDNGGYTLSVADNGKGLPEGFDTKKASSVGLKLVNFLARHQLQATVELESDTGTKFSLRFSETVKPGRSQKE